MIPINEIEILHSLVIEKYGGAFGIRDSNALESALKRPFQTYNGKELHETIIDKAAALIESILYNHPFVDGNKRTGYITMRLFLNINGMDILTFPNDKYQFVMDIASGKINFTMIVNWLEHNTKA